MQMRVKKRGVPESECFSATAARLWENHNQARIELELMFMHRKMDDKILWLPIAHSAIHTGC